MKEEHKCPECADQGISKAYARASALGIHRRAAHKILGQSSTAAYTRAKAAEAQLALPMTVKGKVKTLQCFYCTDMFSGVAVRKRHIEHKHPGQPVTGPEPPTIIPMNPKGLANGQDQEEYAYNQLVAYATGQVTALCNQLAVKENLPQRDFTRRCAEYLYRLEVRQ